MRSTVFDRFKKNGGYLTDSERPTASMPTMTPEMTGKPKSLTLPPEEYTPTSDDEPGETDPAEEAGHHGTMEKPVDLVNSKLVIRLDDGQLYELKKLQQQDTGGY